MQILHLYFLRLYNPLVDKNTLPDKRNAPELTTIIPIFAIPRAYIPYYSENYCVPYCVHYYCTGFEG